jgi:CheY-like chemotaxis protein
MRTLFEEEGYAVAEAHDVAGALDALRGAKQAYVAIVDLFLPQMTGTELLRAIEREPSLARRHRYVATSASMGALSPAIRASLARLHIPLIAKPFDVGAMCDVVAEASAALLPWPQVGAEAPWQPQH